MAGFDFEFSYSADQHPYVLACQRVAKSRARALRCSWRIRHDVEERYVYCEVNGQTRRLDLLGRTLELDLPLVCQGVDGPLSPAKAFELGVGIANLYLVGRDVDRGDSTQVLRPSRRTALYLPVYEFAGTAVDSLLLQARLRITEDLLADFALGRVESVVLLEELHTALEKVMRELIPKSNRMNWPELRGKCDVRGLFPDAQYFSLLMDDPENPKLHAHTPDDLLKILSAKRNRAKHDAQAEDSAWLHAHWECIAAVLEALTGRLTD